MTTLPPEFQQFTAWLNTQPAGLQATFQYCLALTMVHAGHARLLQTIPGESGPLCTFETTAGDIFTLPKPPITTAQEAALLDQLQNILDDEDL